MIACETEFKPAAPDARAAKAPLHLFQKLLVEPGTRVQLGGIDPGYHGKYESRETALPEIQSYLRQMDQLQYLMYAEKKHALLIVLQGLDAAGKDGVVRHIVTGMNSAGCRVIGFKQPTPEDLGHDFLWRVHPHVPAKGDVAIFNRSHYEDVLVVRVHQLAPANVWSRRYDLINDFEKWLVLENNTTVLKFLLYISNEEQLVRFKQRLDDPARRWKISESDYMERKYWDEYIEAFDEMLHKTSTQHAPWFVIPSNNKWFRDLAVSEIITHALDALDMKFPTPRVDIADIRRRYHAAEEEAGIGKLSRVFRAGMELDNGWTSPPVSGQLDRDSALRNKDRLTRLSL
jgi:PPK2 family polyphosphate:nucleotide phosphotransferase